MTQYKVTSDLVSGMDKGELVSEKDFAEGTNFEALVSAGHLAVARTDKPTAPKDEK